MYVFRKKNSARKIDPANVSILLALDLPSIGHTESLIVIKGKEVSLRFEVSNEEAKAVFLRNTTELYRMLAEIGYKLVGTHVSLCKEATRIETAMLHLIAYESGISSGFDLIV
jgi:urease accessory protein UreE